VEHMGWINLGDDYKPIEVSIVDVCVIEQKAMELGVYNSDEHIEGLWIPGEHAIYVVRNPKHNTPEFVLVHEFMHSLDDLSDTHEDEENVIDCKTQLLLAFLKYNRELISLITAKELCDS
tara:strand:+ start:7174 stop:7533 length:360 start_codon:yes stop_codon:yes gene_type:complete